MAVTAVERRSATWAEYDALPERPRAEYIDGEIIVTPPPTRSHQLASSRLWSLLSEQLPPEYEVVESWAWRTGGSEFSPDLMVVAVADIDSDVRFTKVPILCVEILSSNRANDYVTKMAKYAEAGLDHYWILDTDGVLDVMVREGAHFRLAQQVVRETPMRIEIGPRLVVELDLAVILA